MKHPAEDNVLKLRAIEKAAEQVSDIALHHLFCFAGDQEWTHIPTPVAVKEYVPREYFLQFAARCGFANARRAADDDEVFHIAAPWLPRCRAKNRIELSISKSGTSKWLPGLACRVFSVEPSASNSVSMESRGGPASSHCITNSTGHAGPAGSPPASRSVISATSRLISGCSGRSPTPGASIEATAKPQEVT